MFCTQTASVCVGVCSGPVEGSLSLYLNSLGALADNLLVVVSGAERAGVLALPEKVEGAAVAGSLRAVAARGGATER